MSIIVCGPIAIRQPNVRFMKAGEMVLGHRHKFGHTTFITDGGMEIWLLNVTEVNADGNPLNAEVEKSFIIRASDLVNFHFIPAGRWHSLKALVDGTRYQCIYPHRTPTSLTIGIQDKREQEPFTKYDKNGDLWVRVDKNIVEDAAGWAAAYE